MPPPPSDKMRIAERPTAGHAGSEACGEVVRPRGVCSCGTTRLSIAPRLSRIVHGEAGSAALDATQAQFIQANGLPFASQGRFVLVGREVNNATGTIEVATEFENKGSLLRARHLRICSGGRCSGIRYCRG
jgi:hypothetical protein